MAEAVRAFVAIELSDEARRALAGLVDRLREARVRGMRDVRPEGIHLTLKFLGDVPRTQVDVIVAELSKTASQHSPFGLELGSVGVFPNRTRTRVLWVGIGGDLPSLLGLQRGIEDALAGLGFDRDRRPYSPHLTVARVGDLSTAADRRQANDALDAAGFQPGPRIEVRSIVLMQSRLGRDGASYHPLAHIPLDAIFPDGAN